MSSLPTDPSFVPTDTQPVDESNISAMRDQAVIDIWKGKACPNIHDATDAKILEELQSLHNQYCAALSVFASAGITRRVNADELSDHEKWKAVEYAKSLVLQPLIGCDVVEPEPESEPVHPIAQETVDHLVDSVVAADEGSRAATFLERTTTQAGGLARQKSAPAGHGWKIGGI